jgi:tetratricopeptide (TPR) repeat protein
MGSVGGQALVKQASADVSFNSAHYPEAKASYEAAAEEYKRAGLEARAAKARKGVADVMLQQGDLDGAATIYESVLKTAREAGDFRGIVKTLENLGAQYVARGQFDKGERFLREARSEALPLGNPSLLTSLTLNLASVLSYTDQLAESKALAQEALTLAHETNNPEVQTGALILIGDALDAEGHHGRGGSGLP